MLIDLGLAKIVENVLSLDGKRIETGLQTPKLAQIAFWNEYGTSKIPARSFMRESLKGKSGIDLKRVIKNNIKALVCGQQTMMRTINNIGSFHESQIVEIIVDKDDPKNKDSTVAQKGFDDPLIHKGTMRDSIKFIFYF